MKLHKSTARSLQIGTNPEIADLAKELNISLNSETVTKIIQLGMKSLNQEAELECALKKLEEEKRRLTSNFREIAFRSSQLEAKWVGARNRFGRICRDNRALAMRLCGRTLSGVRQERLRNELIQKYIMNYKDT